MSTETLWHTYPLENETPQITVVVPCLNEEEIVLRTYSGLTHALQGLAVDYEILFIDDGSTDHTFAMLRTLASDDKRLRVIRLSRSFGHQIALSAGLDHARGAAVVLIDADLQDPPELIGDMVGHWREGYDVVYGVRRRRDGEPWIRRVVTDVFYRVLGRLSPVHPPKRAADFRLLDRKIVELLRGMPEPDRYLRGMVAWLGLRQTSILYDRRPRIGGRRKYNLRKLTKLATDGMVTSGLNLIRLVSAAGLVLAFTVVLVGIVSGLFVGSGFMWLVAIVGLFATLQFMVCLCMGEYLGRILTATLRRPLYVVEEQVGFDAQLLSRGRLRDRQNPLVAQAVE